MSGAPLLADTADDRAAVPGVLTADPCLEFHGVVAAIATGGVAVLPWRSHARQATCAQVPDAVGQHGFRQALVRVGKGRAATQADLAAAWAALAPGGRLLVDGGNDVGIATWARRVGEQLGVAGEILVNRGKGRLVAFIRTDGSAAQSLAPPSPGVVPLPDGTPLQVAPGVFSGDGLDGGTAALLAALPGLEAPASVADVGCGAGHLALAASRQWPAARILALDADHRAVRCARGNLPAGEVCWWDEADPWPGAPVELALLNPPCHAGTANELATARRLFAAVRATRLVVVANRHLPYEEDLRTLGTLHVLADDGRFKVLLVEIRGFSPLFTTV